MWIDGAVFILHIMSMKLRQTFTLSPEITTRAKHYARRRGMSLSSLVEELLKEKTQPDVPGKPTPAGQASFSRRWMGRGAVSSKDEQRARKLRQKHNL